MKISRTYRLDSEYKKEISSILNGSMKNKFPEIRGLISVTEVSVAPDLKNARVYLSIFDKSEEVKATSFKTIRDNAGFVRHELSQVMRMRTVPALTFLMDQSLEYGAHMEDLFRKIHVEDKPEEQNEEEV